MLETQCIPGLAEKAKQLRAKVADTAKFKASEKSTLVKRKGNKRPTVAEKRVSALEAELREVQDAQKLIPETAEKSLKPAAKTAAQSETSFRRNTEAEESAKKAVDRVIEIQKQVPVSKKAADDALWPFTWTSKRIRLLKGEALVSDLQLSKTGKADDAAVLNTDGRSKKICALEARVRMLRDELGLLRRSESTIFDLDDINCKAAIPQSDITNQLTRSKIQ